MSEGHSPKQKRVAPADIHVGRRIRARRLEAGMSQHALAKRLDISSQQVHKYEAGVNSVGASLMVQIADILQKPPSWFFAAADKHEASLDQDILDRFVTSAEGVRLARAFQGVENKAIRAAILAFVGEIASSRKGSKAALMH